MNSAKGALVGLAVGDALGTSLEFSHQEASTWEAPKLFPQTGIVGGGPFKVLPGQTTDDTMMAACLASSLKACEGLDTDDLGERYKEWRISTFDIGSQTSGSLGLISCRVSASEAGKLHWLSTGKRGAGNGSLMRTAPIGVFFAGDMFSIVAASLADSSITHFDPRCMLACAGFNCAIGAAVKSGAGVLHGGALWDVAKNGLHLAAGMMVSSHPDVESEIASALDNLLEDMTLASFGSPDLYGSSVNLQTSQGFVRVAFRLAFWQLLHADSFSSGVLDTINRGGDADTNGAIVGALLGAHFGLGDIPLEWVETVLGCNPPVPFHLEGSLHPTRLLTIVDG